MKNLKDTIENIILDKNPKPKNPILAQLSNHANEIRDSISSIAKQHKTSRVALDNNDVLLEKNILAFLNDLLNDLLNNKLSISQRISKELKENYILSKQFVEKELKEELFKNAKYTDEFKEVVEKELNNENKQEMISTILTNKSKEIFDLQDQNKIDNIEEKARLSPEDFLEKNVMKAPKEAIKKTAEQTKEKVEEVTKQAVKKVLRQ